MPIAERPDALTENTPTEKVEGALTVPDYVPKEFIGYYRRFAERYSKEVADYFFQDKIEVKKLAEFFGIKLKKHYPFPELENSLINRIRFADRIDDEGGVYTTHHILRRGNAIYYELRPRVLITNTSKELAEAAASWTNIPLPEPRRPKRIGRLPQYHVTRSNTPAILLTCLARPLLTKKENIEEADKIIELFKKKPSLFCDEDGVIMPPPPRSPYTLHYEPKYMRVYKRFKAGEHPEKIAEGEEIKLRTVRSHIYRAEHLESERKQRRERYHKKKAMVVITST